MTFKNKPDYESGKTSYSFTATAKDKANNAATQNVTITIKNDTQDDIDPQSLLPKFSSPTVTKRVLENGSYVFYFTAQNANSYSISGTDASYFSMDAFFQIRFKKSPDYETKRVYKFKVTATNTSGSATQDITINIRDKDDSVMWKGKLYQYLTSPKTGRVWLDRNLGADKVCDTPTDNSCFGDYYQWGRYADGHQSYNSPTRTLLAEKINTSETKFIRNTKDWLTRKGGILGLGDGPDNDGLKRNTIWSKSDGSSICPTGFQVPHSTTITNELRSATNKDDAFNSFLKLPVSGYRHGLEATIRGKNTLGAIWSSATVTTSYESSGYVYTSDVAEINKQSRSHGFPVRCVKAAN